MFIPKLEIGKDTSSVVVVDVSNDFWHQNGAFNHCYGDRDTEPVRKLCNKLVDIVEGLRGKAKLILCRSRYTQNQFGIEKLEHLCTTAWGRDSLSSDELFDLSVDKRDNSIRSAGDNMLREIERCQHIVLTGITTTSCIAQSVDSMNQFSPQKTVIVPRNAVASRKDRQQDERNLFQEWSDPNRKNVIVVDEIGDIKFND